MSWQKQGLIFKNDTSLWWSKRYAGIPTVELLNDEVIRIYYYSMDEHMDGRIAFIDVEAANPSNILYVEKDPILDIGNVGTFDDSGVCPSTIFWINGQKHLFYVGVQRTEKVPYMYFAGLARMKEDGKFERVQLTPFLDRIAQEPFSRSATTIVATEKGFKMWYVSTHSWFDWNGKLYPRYNIRSAISIDGIHWTPEFKDALPYLSKSEFGFGRPWVVIEENLFKMYYSIRAVDEPYRIGYAESIDGENWERKDDLLVLERSPEGWDSEMICYPCVVSTKFGKYMFYNGNSHGASGFGYAKFVTP